MSHDDIENLGSNRSTAPHIDQVVAARYSRRTVLKGSTAAAALMFFGGAQLGMPDSAVAAPRPRQRGGPLLGFTPVPTSSADTVLVPPEYRVDVLIPWGTPLHPGVRDWQPDGSNTAAEQAQQVGFNHDGMHFFPLGAGRGGNRRGLLVLNHEYTDASQIYSARQGSTITDDAAGREKVAKALAAHGVTVVEVVQGADGRWTHVVGSRYNRRVTGTTPVTFSGPVSPSHPALAAQGPPRGTLNNCAHGYTPWGTYLACEENWNGYFGTDDAGWEPSPEQARYGVSATGFRYGWHKADRRFDLAVNANEPHRFGWVVEIDPARPSSLPVKRTALGRIKHESATVTTGRGNRIVVYTGDDENLDYVYKFVGDRPWQAVRARGRSPLDEGTLHVARFTEDGRGAWLPLVHGRGPLTVANGWADQADVLLRTRQAADAVGATPLHRPEWVAVDERTKDVYLTLTNGSDTVKAGQDVAHGNARVNSRADKAPGDRFSNPYGHILRWREDGGDNTALAFSWEIFVLAGDPGHPAVAGRPVDTRRGTATDVGNVFGSPDGIWVDRDTRVWIQTDISNSAQNLAERGYDVIANNQMLVADPVSRQIKRFLVGPRGCEITGVITTPDQRTMFVNVQHPGESTTYWNDRPVDGTAVGAPTPDRPGTVSNWPTVDGAEPPDPAVRPRPATLVIRRHDGGVIGS